MLLDNYWHTFHDARTLEYKKKIVELDMVRRSFIT